MATNKEEKVTPLMRQYYAMKQRHPDAVLLFRVGDFYETYGDDAVRMVVEHCFRDKGFSVLWGDYFPHNPASGRVMEKCGFVDTGRETLCPNLEIGSDQPVRIMKLDRELWLSQTKG